MAKFHKTSKRDGLITSLIATTTAIVVPTYVAPWWIGLVKYTVIGVIVITGYVSGISFHESHSFSTYLLGRVDANVVTFWPTSVENMADSSNIFPLVMICSCCHTNLIDYAHRVFHCLACKHFVHEDCIMANGGWAPISIYGPKDEGLFTAYMLKIEGSAPIALNM